MTIMSFAICHTIYLNFRKRSLVHITTTDGRYHKDCSGIAIILKKIQLDTVLLLTIIQ